MAVIRVFLITCRRPTLLPRALDSLRRQTFTDWVCELHNDAPEDASPRELLKDINDSRITLQHHSEPWGAAKSFRHAFTGGPESLSSLLEDDNWWAPEFLETALEALQNNPDVGLVWANSYIWRENLDQSWEPTGRTIWQGAQLDTARPLVFSSLEPIQCFNALHSNGATLFRSDVSHSVPIPNDVHFDSIEFVRERLFPGKMMLLPQPLGYFALTLGTARGGRRYLWLRSQLLCAASYICVARPDKDVLATIWQTLRTQQPPGTGLLFHVAMAGIRPWGVLRHAKLIDWFRFIRGLVRHPLTSVYALGFRRKHPETWRALLSAPGRKGSASDASPIYRKVIPGGE